MTSLQEGTGKAEYLGDGVYLLDDGYQLWISLDKTLYASDCIALDYSVFKRLCELGEARFREIIVGDKE